MAIRGGAPAGLKNSRGCGSKVITQTGRARASAAARAWSSKAWWPRWTPSKLPIVSAQSARLSALGRPRKTLTIAVEVGQQGGIRVPTQQSQGSMRAGRRCKAEDYKRSGAARLGPAGALKGNPG